jgi:SAM-dependent methyltransferase
MKQFMTLAETFGFFKKGNTILDLGCGTGSLGDMPTTRSVRYIGIDISKKDIELCQSKFAAYNNMKFMHMDVLNDLFNPSGTIPPLTFKLPFRDECFDDLIAYSVFTHLQTKEVADRFIQEIWRVLKPGGKFFSTWYRSPPNLESTDVNKTCYKESDILSFIQGFTFDHTCGGQTAGLVDPWCLFGDRL